MSGAQCGQCEPHPKDRELLLCTETAAENVKRTLILKALLNPLAKKPPNGPIRDANVDNAMLCIWKGYKLTVS